MEHTDIRQEIERYSAENGFPANDFEPLVCDCGCEEFTLFSDARGGGALAVCAECEMNLSIYDSADFIEDIGQNICECGHDRLYLMTGMAHYPDTVDVRWVYVGAKCTACGLVGVFVDWEEP